MPVVSSTEQNDIEGREATPKRNRTANQRRIVLCFNLRAVHSINRVNVFIGHAYFIQQQTAHSTIIALIILCRHTPFIHPINPHQMCIRDSSESPGEIHCEITNSYHPKSVADKSGSGIGLEQVRKRLELTYPDRYDWQQGVSERCV